MPWHAHTGKGGCGRASTSATPQRVRDAQQAASGSQAAASRPSPSDSLLATPKRTRGGTAHPAHATPSQGASSACACGSAHPGAAAWALDPSTPTASSTPRAHHGADHESPCCEAHPALVASRQTATCACTSSDAHPGARAWRDVLARACGSARSSGSALPVRTSTACRAAHDCDQSTSSSSALAYVTENQGGCSGV